jgi:hypothetical protein
MAGHEPVDGLVRELAQDHFFTGEAGAERPVAGWALDALRTAGGCSWKRRSVLVGLTRPDRLRERFPSRSLGP